MSKALDLTNKTFGRLRVIRKHHGRNEHGKILWECLCDPELGGCGNTIQPQSSHLNAGYTTSCGCLAIEVTKATNTKHGYTKFPEYKIWNAMKRRCYDPKDDSYPDYGGRGIVMCDEWKESFETFYNDMGPRPSSDYSIERENNDDLYCKSNCKWATRTEQANNRRSNVFYEYKGERKTLPQWCRELSLNYTAIEQRIRVLGMSFERAIIQSELKRSEHTYNGKTMNLGEWCRELDLNYNVMDARIRKLGMSFEMAISFVPPTGKTEYSINGATRTLKGWCIERNMSVPKVIYRLYRSWTIEEALTPIESRAITYSTSGLKRDEETHSLQWWCGLLGLDEDKTYLRILRGETLVDTIAK